MTQPVRPPTLTPEFCFSTATLRDFLRLSRASLDDSISQNLNALMTPSDEGFDPRSTSHRSMGWQPSHISPKDCQSFKDKILFPAWQARADVLNYCESVARSPDPDDPEAALREVQKQRNDERVVDQQIDPYLARPFPQEARTQTLAALVQQERGIENIVRSQTWDVVQQRCSAPSESWRDAARRWSDSKSRGKNGSA